MYDLLQCTLNVDGITHACSFYKKKSFDKVTVKRHGVIRFNMPFSFFFFFFGGGGLMYN